MKTMIYYTIKKRVFMALAICLPLFLGTVTETFSQRPACCGTNVKGTEFRADDLDEVPRSQNTLGTATPTKVAWPGPTNSEFYTVEMAQDLNQSGPSGERMMDVRPNTKEYEFSNSYAGDFKMPTKSRWHKNGGHTGNGKSPDHYVGRVYIRFTNPVPANEIVAFVFDMERRGVSGTAPDGYVRFHDVNGDVISGGASTLNYTNAPSGNSSLTYNSSTGDLGGFGNGTTTVNKYIAVNGTSNTLVKEVRMFVRNIVDDVGFSLGAVDPCPDSSIVTITDMEPPACVNSSKYAVFFETSDSSNSTLTLNPAGLTATRESRTKSSGKKETAWYVEVPVGDNLTVKVEENGCKNTKSYVSPKDCSDPSKYPLGVKYFLGNLHERGIMLSWAFNDAKDLAGGILERGASPASLEGVHAFGHTQGRAFSYLDSKPAEGENYYRLRLKDASGKTSHSDFIVVYYEAGGSYAYLAPNPSPADRVLLKTNIPLPHIEAFDAAGGAIGLSARKMEGGYRLSLRGRGAGPVLLRVRGGATVRTLRLVLE